MKKGADRMIQFWKKKLVTFSSVTFYSYLHLRRFDKKRFICFPYMATYGSICIFQRTCFSSHTL